MSNKGFTLIELVMIIIILGILSAVAIPKYVDLKTDAENAAIKGIYGGIQSSYGVAIAQQKGSPLASEINAIINGTPGDLTVNGSATTIAIEINVADETIQNTILGTKRRGLFNVTSNASSEITTIGSLSFETL